MKRDLKDKPQEYVFLGLGFLTGLAGWCLLLILHDSLPPTFFPLKWAFFVLLSLLVKGWGSRIVPRENHSLVDIVDLAGILLFGPLGGAWVAATSAILYQVARTILSRRSSEAARTASLVVLLASIPFDSGIKVGAALAAGQLYALAGGIFPPDLSPSLTLIGPAALLFLSWFILDHLGWIAAEAILGGVSRVREWFEAVIGPSLLMELLPLPLSLLVVATHETPLTFALVVGGLFGTSLAIQQLFAAAQEQRRMAREQVTLNEIAREIVQAELNVDGLIELIYEQVGRVVDTSFFHLGLLEGEDFTLKLRVVNGERQDRLTVTLAPGEGIIGWMIESKQPLLVHDFDREMDQLPARPRYISRHPPRSGVYVPLIASGKVIGSISIQNPRPNAFSMEHVRILSFIANQAAVAIEKARLYQSARERAIELEDAAQENVALYVQVREERDRLELVHDVTRDLTRRLDLDDLLNRLIQRTVDSLHAEDGTIVLAGTRREPPRAISTRGEPEADLETILEQGLAGWALRQRQQVLVDDASKDPRWLQSGHTVRSVISVPILHSDTDWGAITLTHSQEGFFTAADLALLATMAEQAAVALEAARLYEAQRRRAVQLQTIAQVMRSILSILELDRLLGEVVHLVKQRFGYTHVHIFTLEPEERQAFFRASTDPESPFWKSRGGKLSLDEGLIGWVATHGEPVMVGDVRQDPRWLPDEADVRSEVAVALRIAEETVGVLDVQDERTDAFDEEDLFILRTLADQIAMALETARLYETQQEEAWVLNALLQVAQNIALARDLDELLEVVVRLVPLLVGVEPCILFLRDREDGSFHAIHGYGVRREDLAELHFAPGEASAFDQTVEQANPVVLVGPEEHQTIPPLLWQTTGGGTTWLFPLLVGGEVSSILLLGLEQGRTDLSSRQNTILNGITNQAGIAIEEARLRRVAAERQRLEQELSVAREIQRSMLPQTSPEVPGWSIEASWQSARQVGGDFYDFIHLADDRLGIVIADVSDKGVPAALFMVLSRSLVRASAINYESPAEALMQANRLLLESNEADMFVTVFYGVIDLRSGEMRYASAGHNPPLLCRKDPAGAENLTARGMILGVMEQVQLEERIVQLDTGAILILYTDGVTEAINTEEEEFGEERLVQFICAHPDQDLKELRQGLLSAVEEFSQGRPPFDDLTLVLVRRET